MRTLKIITHIPVVLPEGATHYIGDHRHIVFYKRKDVGAAGEHWFCSRGPSDSWDFVSHHQPHWILPIPEDLILDCGAVTFHD